MTLDYKVIIFQMIGKFKIYKINIFKNLNIDISKMINFKVFYFFIFLLIKNNEY